MCIGDAFCITFVIYALLFQLTFLLIHCLAILISTHGHPCTFTAATKIQALFRGGACRSRVQAKKQKLAAVIKIQSLFRGTIGRIQARARKQKLVAATKIQCLFRGIAGRSQAQLRKQELMHVTKLKVHSAALKIQSLFRGNSARAQVFRAQIKQFSRTGGA